MLLATREVPLHILPKLSSYSLNDENLPPSSPRCSSPPRRPGFRSKRHNDSGRGHDLYDQRDNIRPVRNVHFHPPHRFYGLFRRSSVIHIYDPNVLWNSVYCRCICPIGISLFRKVSVGVAGWKNFADHCQHCQHGHARRD